MHTEMASDKVLKQNLEENLKAIEWHETCQGLLKTWKIYFEITVSFIYEVLKSRRFKGEKLLEIGSGATVHNIASASAYFPNIVQSDFVEDNVKHLRQWHEGKSPLDWSAFLDMVVVLEDFNSDPQEVRTKLESRIRKSVKAVVRSDVLSDNVLKLEEIPAEASPPYDLIIAIHLFEVTCLDFESFVNTFKRVKKLLRRGGGLILCCFYDSDEWVVGGKKFKCFKIDIKGVVAALNKAGFGNHDVRRFAAVKSAPLKEIGGYYCIATEVL